MTTVRIAADSFCCGVKEFKQTARSTAKSFMQRAAALTHSCFCMFALLQIWHSLVVSFMFMTPVHLPLLCPGEREPISLSKEKIKWVLPPGVHASEEAASASDSEADEDGRTHHPGRGAGRGRGRKHDFHSNDDRPRKLARSEVGLLPTCKTRGAVCGLVEPTGVACCS